MILRPPRSTRTDTLFPYTTLFRSRRADLLYAMAGVSDRRSPPYRLALSGARKHQENRPRYPRTGLHQSGAELRHDVHAALHVRSRHAAGTDRPLPAVELRRRSRLSVSGP